MRIRILLITVTISLFAIMIFAVCDKNNKNEVKEKKVDVIDLTQYKDTKPEKMMRLLFIHHSCGGMWLAERGKDKELVPDTCIYESSPEGGGLRLLLQQNNYEVHEAAYKSAIGNNTDVCDWNAKFRDKMKDILRCDRQDVLYTDPTKKNDIVMFKSCFPANAIESDGQEPGNPDSPDKTTANYKAAYNKLLGYFKAQPNTLFVCLTAPPLVENYAGRITELKRKLLAPEKGAKAVGERARSFNNWLKDSEHGWLAGYELKNVVVYDLYDVLTRHGESNYTLYPSNKGTDSHPNAEGNSIAAQDFVFFLNKAVKRFAGSP